METFIHTKTGNEYSVIGPCLIKVDGVWKDGVEYVRSGVDKKFVREISDFQEKFKPVDKSGDRYLFNELKRRNFSVGDVQALLKQIGVMISVRTLQNHLDEDMKNCKEPIIEKVIRKMIENYDEMVETFKHAKL